MKNRKKSLLSLMCLLFVLAFAMTSFAADSKVTYKGRKSGFEIAPGSVYVETDLFDNFKQVMPGDVREEKITLTNSYSGCDYVIFHMGALLHDEENNPISPKVLKALTEDERRGTMSELEYMQDFLKQLTLTIWKGEKKPENIIYQGTPDSLESGFEGEKVFIGSLGYKRSVDLNVELAVDIEMGDEYAGRIGEVDWVFVIVERNNSGGGDDPTDETKPPMESGESEDDRIVNIFGEEDGPNWMLGRGEEGPSWNLNSPKTGDETQILPYILLLVAALAGMFIVAVGKRKKKNEE